MQFVQWLGENVPELKGQSPEQIVETVNKLSASKEGQQMLQGLIQEFESSSTGMFKKGGKLAYLLCLKKGGNIQDCGCGSKVKRNQPGGTVEIEKYPHASRKDALDAAMSLGMTKKQAKQDYKTEKKREQLNGKSGNDLKQTARYTIIDAVYPRAQLPVLDDVVIDEEPIIIDDSQFVPLNVNTNINPMAFKGSFNSAFAAARKGGLNEFTWNNKRYNTDLATNRAQSAFIDAVNTGIDKNHYVVSGPDGRQFVQKINK